MDIMQRLIGSVEKLRGHCFDGASNMSGRISGVRARLAEVQPKSMYVHCANHSLDLVLVELAKRVPLVADVMNLVRDVFSALNTAKRKNLLKQYVLESRARVRDDPCIRDSQSVPDSTDGTPWSCAHAPGAVSHTLDRTNCGFHSLPGVL